ncbi:MAG: ankyrin repeat domain-containing protein, partial [Acidobacteria bacterium]
LLDERDDYGRTLLMGAACNNDKSVVEYLLENGRDVNAKNSNGWTALMYAAKGGCKEIVELLIEKGADVNAQDEAGWTALMYAGVKCCKETFELLIERGVDPSVKDNRGWTVYVITGRDDDNSDWSRCCPYCGDDIFWDREEMYENFGSTTCGNCDAYIEPKIPPYEFWETYKELCKKGWWLCD